ncbi:MAG: hypothetical protein ACI8UZ_000430 [Akkermansiaceae bacterium]|jgi:hypothetical protein
MNRHYFDQSAHRYQRIEFLMILAFIASLGMVTAAKAQSLHSTDYDLSQTFRLHSNPASSKKIYLDFDGFNGYYHVYNPWTMDSNADSFSDAEKRRIHEVWQAVTEDFLAFDVDVTTEDPGRAALSKANASDQRYGVRVVIDGNGSHDPIPGDSEGAGTGSNGSSFYSYSWAIDTFDYDGDYETYVFPDDHSWIWIADSVSHEVGHTLGLDHDGERPGDGDYWYGHGSNGSPTYYSPIMGWTGAGVSQWSKGEYDNATNTEDDLQIITTQNGFGYRLDDHGNTTGTATAMTLSGGDPALVAEGNIEKKTDLDYFCFILTQRSQVQISIDTAVIGPNLDILATLRDSGGTPVETSNPPNQLKGAFDLELEEGTYYLSIDGTGHGNPSSNGYSDYGSLGYFSISGAAEVLASPTPFQAWAASEGLTEGVNDGASQDADSGGNNNFFEFAFGGNPRVDHDDKRLVHSFLQDGDPDSDRKLLMTVAMRSGAESSFVSGPRAPLNSTAVDGIIYSVSGSDGLTPFDNARKVSLVFPAVETGLGPTPAGYLWMTFALDVSTESSTGFLRATATLIP